MQLEDHIEVIHGVVHFPVVRKMSTYAQPVSPGYGNPTFLQELYNGA